MLSVIQHMPIVPMKGTVGFFALIVLIKRISIREGEEQDKDGTSEWEARFNLKQRRSG
ncbi:hypothetical protein [Paenibacillus stellifer]|uniref:hypothetical protein n=1 Tax=Paenibacillus stellifer TaxID=169760 RepID=UPI0014706C3A|nr:hypothetical protein [Paenibacillus stellifer]